MIKINFTIGDLTDALYIPEDVYATLTADQIEAMKQARYTAYQDAVSTTSLSDSPPEEEGENG
jgi:hypothetical protein